MKMNRLFIFWLIILSFIVSASVVGCVPQHKQTQTRPAKQAGIVEPVRLPTPDEAIAKLGNISGAVYERKTKRVVLIGSGETANQTPMRLEDLAVALKSLNDDFEEPRFSLDAAEPKNPRGPNLQAVYYGPIERTHFGQAMFDADWLLKCYSFGKLRKADGSDGLGQTISSAVPGFKNLFDLAFERQGSEGETWTRLWITADESAFGRYNDTIRLERLRMKVNTERMWATSKGLESSGGQQDPDAELFAAHFTENYDKFANEQPAFQVVKELSKAVVLAKWIKQEGIDVDPAWIAEFSRGNWNTPRTVGALEASQERSGQTSTRRWRRTMRLFGGVDLAIEPKYYENAGLAVLEANARTYLAKPDASPIFSITYEGKKYPAMVVPITEPGKTMWQKAGVSYLIDGRARAVFAWLPPEAIGAKEDRHAMRLAA